MDGRVLQCGIWHVMILPTLSYFLDVFLYDAGFSFCRIFAYDSGESDFEQSGSDSFPPRPSLMDFELDPSQILNIFCWITIFVV